MHGEGNIVLSHASVGAKLSYINCICSCGLPRLVRQNLKAHIAIDALRIEGIHGSCEVGVVSRSPNSVSTRQLRIAGSG